MFYKTTQTGKSKYHSVKQSFKGNSYDSKAEASYAMYLDSEKKGKRIKDWKPQVKVELFGENKTRVCNYFIDFLVTHNDDCLEYIEIKGFETAIWRLKWKLIEDKLKGNTETKLTLIKV